MRLLTFLLVICALVTGCQQNIPATTRIEYFLEEGEVQKILAGTWLVLPMGNLGRAVDPAEQQAFRRLMRAGRPDQRLVMFDVQPESFSPTQENAWRTWSGQVRQPDPRLLRDLVEGVSAPVIIAPVLFGLTINRTADGAYQRKLVMQVWGWTNPGLKRVFFGSATAVSRAPDREALRGGRELLAAAIASFAAKLIWNPMAGLEPQTKPDF